MFKYIFALDTLVDVYQIEKTGEILAVSPEDISHVVYVNSREDREGVARVYIKGIEKNYKVLSKDLNNQVEKWFKRSKNV